MCSMCMLIITALLRSSIDIVECKNFKFHTCSIKQKQKKPMPLVNQQRHSQDVQVAV